MTGDGIASVLGRNKGSFHAPGPEGGLYFDDVIMTQDHVYRQTGGLVRIKYAISTWRLRELRTHGAPFRVHNEKWRIFRRRDTAF